MKMSAEAKLKREVTVKFKSFINLSHKLLGYKDFGFYEIEGMNWGSGRNDYNLNGRYVTDRNNRLQFKDGQLLKVNGKPFKP